MAENRQRTMGHSVPSNYAVEPPATPGALQLSMDKPKNRRCIRSYAVILGGSRTMPVRSPDVTDRRASTKASRYDRTAPGYYDH